jgi:RNA polymerase sigma-70 factor (ECF subfamily)
LGYRRHNFVQKFLNYRSFRLARGLLRASHFAMQTASLASIQRPQTSARTSLRANRAAENAKESPEIVAERAFVVRLIADEPAAWRELSERHSPMIHRAIGRVMGRFGSVSGSDDVREIYAKVCLSLIARDKFKLRSFDPAKGARLSSWLVRIAMQASYDHLRRIRRNPCDNRFELPEVASESPDQFTLCWERERAQLVVAAIAQLSTREREFMKLYFGEGLEPEEIAERMNISVKTVYTKKHKLQARLEEILSEQRRAAA